MKKFLSSLLALTMILSLVIVPAKAATGEATTFDPWSVDMSAENLEKEYSISGVAEGSTFAWRTGNSDIADFSGDRDKASAKIVARRAGTTTIYCVVTPPDTAEVKTPVEYSGTIEVTNRNRDFKNAITTISVLNREYSTTKNIDIDIVTFGTETLESSAFSSNLGNGTEPYTDITYTYSAPTKTSKSASLKITGKKGSDPVEATFRLWVSHYEKGSVTVLANDAARNDESNPLVVNAGQVVKLKATAYNGNADASYSWTATAQSGSATSPTGEDKVATWVAPGSTNSNGDKYTITCTVTDGNVTTHGYAYISVVPDPYHADYSNSKREFTIVPSSGKDSCDIEKENKPILKANSSGISDITSGYTVAYKITSGSDIVTVNQLGKVTAKSNVKSGTATITATITFNGKNYEPLTYKVNITALDSELASIVNGESDSYSQTNVKDKLADAIKKQDSSFRYNDIDTITVVGTPSRVTLKDGKTTLSNGSSVTDGFTIYADEAYIGDASFQLKVNNNYVVTMYLTVDSKGEIKDTVTGTSAGKSVTFTNSDYDYLYIYEGSASFKSDMYNGDWSRTSNVSRNWKPVAENKDYTVSSSAFDRNGKATLYVVAVDNNIASTGTITVSQKSYDIKYSVVAGESVTFSQKDFESFLEDIADDAGNYNSRKDTLELSYVKFSLPNSTREGVLYEGKSKIDRNDKVEDLDKVTFESVAKAKDTITISFTAYGKLYKDGASKGKDVDYSGNVVISVVKEDIVFEVGVNSAIKLGSDKFIDFLRDSDKSYKKADLDYVTFDVGKNSAITSYFNGTGALYRYYNGSTGINATVSAKDEFYYNPKTSSKHYDLDDVTYVTSKFAKVGDIVYIPFTAYGTKSGQKAEGTLAIKVKQTMSFVDVRPGDYFYDSVQWAVNLDITKGTSATTFSPKQGCTRAQIVTFLWRAANSPAPRSSTNKFTDVYATTHADYMKAIIWATEQGITTGTGNGKFSPDATCTRAQIVTFLYRFKNNPAVYGSLNFSDVNKTEHAAFYNAILWAVNNKITTGYGNGIFDPNGTCNRGDAVTFLYRALA